MSDWQKDLENKFMMLKKEETHGQETNRIIPKDRSDSSRSDNSNSPVQNASDSNNSIGSGSRNILSRRKDTEINTDERRSKSMIPAKGLFDDLTALKAKMTTEDGKLLIEAMEKIAKVALNCRTNTMKIMEKLGIPKEEPVRKEGQKPA